jgi:hypothetical protein
MISYFTINNGFYKSRLLKSILFILLFTAFIFGYLDQLFPYNFERLHIFLFNHSIGGFTILYFTENKRLPSIRTWLFLFLSIAFALFAFFELYIPSIVIAFILFLIVERIRIQQYPFFPKDFFSIHANTSSKFHQASLLCLSIGLFISALVMINNEYLHLVTFEKLKLNVFFLGFSFPVSLIALSLVFSFIKDSSKKSILYFKHAAFWLINLGVIVFFVLIIFQLFWAKFFIAFILFCTVTAIFIFFFRHGINIQQKFFLISGIYFLLSTAITGLSYIPLVKTNLYDDLGKVILNIHAYLSLYGWNLTGLMIIMRWNDFPLKLNTGTAILFHWFIMLIIAPLGKQNIYFAIIAVILYTIFLLLFFVGKKKIKVNH